MRLLIVSNNMHIGGVQKALVNMLECIHTKYDITLLLLYKGGEYLGDIPSSVKVIQASSFYKYLGMTKYDAGTAKDKLLRAFFAGITRVIGRRYAVSIMSLFQPVISGYDVSISYLHNGGERLFMGGCNDFVLKHTDAPTKITFLHCDFAKIGARTKENISQYPKFDKIAACSDGCRAAFLSEMPELSDKTFTVKNFQCFDKINEKSENMPILSREKLNILTVARLGGEKGVLRGVKAISTHKNASFHYYVVGDGAERGAIEEYIRENGLSDKITLCGELSDPYGYMRACDLLLIPSYSEAAPVVIDEAASLGTPILSTRTSSADEMISDRALGWVCENSDKALTDALGALISTPERVKEKKDSLKNIIFDNKTAEIQLEKLVSR